MNIAILLTVYNRKAITINSLNSLFPLINKDSFNNYDIYMTNDGCTDGTEEHVKQLYPQVKIINHKGNLFWSRGMNIAWETAVKIKKYDYYIWFNDDAELFPNALEVLLNSKKHNTDCIITGAFCSIEGNVTYGGKNKKHKFIEPNGCLQDVHYMNGNLVLIPHIVYEKIGYIDKIFTHGLGDFDYGLRAQKKGFKVLLTPSYIGKTERHDNDLYPFFSYKHSLFKRFKLLYSTKYSIIPRYKYNNRHHGTLKAISSFLLWNIGTLFPFIYRIK